MEASLFPEDHLRNNKKFFEGVCDKIHYESQDSFYRVLSLRLNDLRLITVAGQFGPVHVGERLKVWGEFVFHNTYGNRLEVKDFQLLLPQSAPEVERFLASGFIPGIGKKMAKTLVEHHGAQVLRLMSEDPKKLEETPGIGKKRLSAILQSWQEKVEDREFQILLRGWGLTERMVNEVKQKFGHQRIPQIKENPYLLAQFISNFSFQRADSIAQTLGFAPDSPKRILSSSKFFLKKALDEGHCYLPLALLLQKLTHYLKIEAHLLIPLLKSCSHPEELLLFEEYDQPCYLPYFYKLECYLAKRLLLQRGESPHPISSEIFDRVLKQLSHLSQEQKSIIQQMINQRFAILTGGPGVGKTTVLKAIYQIFEQSECTLYLAAPTGRAAKRMETATGVPTQTIHRLLRLRPDEMSLEKSEKLEKLSADVVILDECSMLDAELFALLLTGLHPSTRLYLVGDADQLPSVGAGNVLADLLRSQLFPTFRLTQIFRQKEQSSIVLNAHQILKGEDLASDQGGTGDFYIIKQQQSDKVVPMLLEMLLDRIPKQFQIEPEEIQILCPMRKGKLGTNALNLAIQQKLQRSEIKHGFCLKDKVMQTKNNYDKDVFNGDIGTISELNASSVKVQFKQRLLEYKISELNELQLAYAISIHKSQGSEFAGVIIPLAMEQFTMLQKNLLYTAVTRGKLIVVLIGDPRAIQRALQNNQIIKRYTHLETYLHQESLQIPLF